MCHFLLKYFWQQEALSLPPPLALPSYVHMPPRQVNDVYRACIEKSTTEPTATEQADQTGTGTAGDPMDRALLKELLREVLAKHRDAGGKGPTLQVRRVQWLR